LGLHLLNRSERDGALSVAWKGIDPTTSLWSIRASIAFTCEKWKHR